MANKPISHLDVGISVSQTQIGKTYTQRNFVSKNPTAIPTHTKQTAKYKTQTQAGKRQMANANTEYDHDH